MVNLLSLLANITVINKSKHIFLYFFLISFISEFPNFSGNFSVTLLCKLSKFPETFLETSGNCLEVFNPTNIQSEYHRQNPRASRFFLTFQNIPFFLLYSYRKFHSSETALLKLTNDIMETTDSGKITMVTALDICPQPLILRTTLHFFIDFSTLSVHLVMLSLGFVRI